MAYPDKPQILTSYTSEEQSIGNGTLPGQELDVDFASLKTSQEQVIDFLKLFTRSDGKLANGIVTQEALAPSILIGFDPPTVWATAQAYTTRSTVFQGQQFYLCVIAHTSSVFATDLSAGRWQLLADLTPVGGALLASNNLSDLADAATARTNLGLGSMASLNTGTSGGQFRTNSQNEAFFQPLDATLTAFAGVTGSADVFPYFTGADAFATAPVTAFARTILDDANAAAVRTTLGATVTGAALFTAADAAAARTAVGATVTGSAVLTAVDAAAARTAIGAGTGAPDFVLEDQKASGTNGQTIASANTWTTRDLNTEVRDVAGIVSITSNEFTVTANCWVEWTVPGRDHFQSRLYNVTDAVVTAVGEVTGNTSTGGRSHGGAAVVAGKTYRIEHNTSAAGQISQNARGQAGTIEVYTRVRGWRT